MKTNEFRRWFNKLPEERRIQFLRDNPDLRPVLSGKKTRTQGGRHSALEASFTEQVRTVAGFIPAEWKREYQFDDTGKRRFRFDFAWINYKIAVEIQGGQWVAGGGRHQRGVYLANEYTKLNLATLQGWSVYLFSTSMIIDATYTSYSTAISTLLQAFGHDPQRVYETLSK